MTCALCSASAPLTATPVDGGPQGASVELCAVCLEQLQAPSLPNHWRCLSAAMWSEDAATQVLAARILAQLSDHDWARDLSAQLWLADDIRAWADNIPQDSAHRDANGAPLAQGDTVVLIKDLQVKGAGFTAKRGTAVRGIALVADNPAQIEGRVEGQRIVILTEFVRRK